MSKKTSATYPAEYSSRRVVLTTLCCLIALFVMLAATQAYGSTLPLFRQIAASAGALMTRSLQRSLSECLQALKELSASDSPNAAALSAALEAQVMTRDGWYAACAFAPDGRLFAASRALPATPEALVPQLLQSLQSAGPDGTLGASFLNADGLPLMPLSLRAGSAETALVYVCLLDVPRVMAASAADAAALEGIDVFVTGAGGRYIEAPAFDETARLLALPGQEEDRTLLAALSESPGALLRSSHGEARLFATTVFQAPPGIDAREPLRIVVSLPARALFVREMHRYLTLLAYGFFCATVVYMLYKAFTKRHILELTRERNAAVQRSDTLAYDSTHDALTGLGNRKRFEEWLKENADKRSPCGLMLCDVDRLKLMNDAFGHPAGDALLRRAAQALQAVFPEGAELMRIGGDEFVAVVPFAGNEAMRTAGSRLDEEIRRRSSEDDLASLSVSCGWLSNEGAAYTATELYREADRRMYQSKLAAHERDTDELIASLLRRLARLPFEGPAHMDRLASAALRLCVLAGASPAQREGLLKLCRMHDIGMIGFPADMLLRQGPLTPQEHQDVRRHCEIGYRIAGGLPEFAAYASFILQHHTHFDGSNGFLDARGESLALECRVFAIVDAWDAMTTPRPYRRAMRPSAAAEELARCAGTHFDPELVKLWIGAVKEAQATERAVRRRSDPPSAPPLAT